MQFAGNSVFGCWLIVAEQDLSLPRLGLMERLAINTGCMDSFQTKMIAIHHSNPTKVLRLR